MDTNKKYRWEYAENNYMIERLLGPNNEIITSIYHEAPEDLRGSRDLAPIVDELNRLYAELKEK